MSRSLQALLADRSLFESVEEITPGHFAHEPLHCFRFGNDSQAQAAAEAEIEQRLSDVAVYKITYRSGLAGPAGGTGDLLVHGFVAAPRSFSLRLPLILFNRGGNNMADKPERCPYPPHRVGRLTDSDAVLVLGRLASWGYCVAASQYRGCYDLRQKDEFGGNDLHDVVNLRALFQGSGDVDCSRTGALGYSRGAIMSFLLAAHYDWLRSIIAVGGHLDNKQDEDSSRSPLHLVHRLRPELQVQLIHAERDAMVKCQQHFEPMLGALKQHGLEVTGHCFDSDRHYVLDHDKEVAALIQAWFARTL